MAESFQHRLERYEAGVVWLDRHRHVVAVNRLAETILDIKPGEVFGREILQFHPEKSRPKVSWLLDSSECPVESPPPMTMMINVPDRVLLIKVSKMFGESGESAGTCMVFFDLTEETTSPERGAGSAGLPRQLFKLPIYTQGRVVLVDLDSVIHLKAEGHYTEVFTAEERYLCNLSLADLEARLAPELFVRVHRSHMINIHYVDSFDRQGEQPVLLMKGSSAPRIPISRTHMPKIKQLLGLT